MSVACQTRCTYGISFNPHHKPGTQLLYYNTEMNPHTIQSGEAGGQPILGEDSDAPVLRCGLAPPCLGGSVDLDVMPIKWRSQN